MNISGLLIGSDEAALSTAANCIARLAMGACDGDPHKDPRYPRLTQFPTRRRAEALVRLVLTPNPDGREGMKLGLPLETLFAAAWEAVDADEGEDSAAKDLLADFYAAILDGAEAWAYSPAAVDRAVLLLASFDPVSLWVRFAQSAYPDSPQTPGSAKWDEAEAGGNPHESVANPFLR